MVNIADDMNSPVFIDEPFMPRVIGSITDRAFTVGWHDRQGTEYELMFCDPAKCEENADPTIVHAVLIARSSFLPGVIDIPLTEDDFKDFGRPTSQSEALDAGIRYAERFKAVAETLFPEG